MNNLILEITGGDRPPQRVEVGPDEALAIGRQEDNDLVLDSRHISRHHCRVTGAGGKWTIEDLASANGVRINGKKMLTHQLASGDEIVIHPFTLNVVLPTPEPDMDDDRTVIISSDSLDPLDEDETVVTSVTSVSGSSDSDECEDKTVVQPAPAHKKEFSSILTPRVRITVLSCITVLMLVVIGFKIMSGDDDKNPGTSEHQISQNVTGVQETEVGAQTREKAADESMPLEQKRERAMLLYQANNYIREAKYDMAANRLQAALEIVPDDTEIKALFNEVSEKLKETKAAELARKNMVKNFRSALEKGQHDASVMLAREDFEGAMSLINNLMDERVHFPELKEEFEKLEKLKKEIGERYAAWKKEEDKKSALRKKTIQEIRQEYNEGLMMLRAGKYWDALKHWNNVSDSGADIPEREEVESRLPELQKLMERKVVKDYEKGLSYYRKKDYPNALKCWDRVLKIYPEHPQTKEKMAEILPIQEKKAKRLYQEGLVYEGINNISKAVSKWKKAIKTAPIDSSIYYKKALGKLSEYGQK